MMHDVYALIDNSVFGFSHEGWSAFARARAEGFEPEVFDYAEVMLQEDPDENDPLPDELRDVDSWTAADWHDHLDELAGRGVEDRYLALAAELEAELGFHGAAA